MVLILENEGTQRCALEGSTVEAFTQKQFSDLVNESFMRQSDYYIARLICSADTDEKRTKKMYYCYDARQLCKYVFEMVISSEGRSVQIKNFKDPIHQKPILELYFFRLRYESETPMRAEYVGSHLDFLESQSFRSRIFNQEEPLDALSVNFKLAKQQNIPFLTRKQLMSVFVIILALILLVTVLIIAMDKGKSKDVTLSEMNTDREDNVTENITQ
ncbi:hypothetical protein H312_00754 [Anncaliia algerae PRA339]|uniref:Uncharacterized protein n=1 Tax=Anncaliia algerae PRA339 TaxID=1288291 RepID=A0A059F3R8_9MICR|nr:hypothetical protein H312_00754 [Anncaliia algerae PRA339]